MSARQLAEKLKTEPATVQRDLKALRAAGLEIAQAREGGQLLYRWSGPPELGTVQPDEDEWVALFLSATELRMRGLSRQGKALAAVAGRAAVAPRPPSRALVGPALREEVIQPLLRAAIDHRALLLQYRSVREEEVRPREVYPELLFHDGTSTLFVAHGPDFEEPRLFVAQRIERLQETGGSFAPLQRFRIDDFVRGAYRVIRGDAVQKVRIRFKPELEPELHSFQWPAETGVERMSSGYIRVTVMMTLTPELERWLLSFGARLQVLEPLALQASLQNRLLEAGSVHFSPAAFDRPLE